MIQKTTIPISFSQGLDTKTDPKQVQMGKFLSLQNTIFQNGGLLQKRNGYAPLTSVSSTTAYLTTLNDNLIAIGDRISAYSSTLSQRFAKGAISPCSLSVLPLVRNALDQVQCDSVVSDGLVCTVYTESYLTDSATVTQYFVVIADAVTGQNITQPVAIPPIATGAISGSSRVFVVGGYFVIVSQVLVSSTSYLQYVSIPVSQPISPISGGVNVSAAQNVTSEAYVPISSNPGWDASVVQGTAGGVLVVAYNTTVGAQGIHVAALTVQQIAQNLATAVIKDFANAAYIGAIVSTCVDETTSPEIVYVSFWNNGTTNGYTFAVYLTGGESVTIGTQFGPQEVISGVTCVNLASAAQNGDALVFSEVSNNYSYDNSIPTHFINGVSVSSAGSVGTPYVSVRSVGLASKAFVVDGTIYYLAAYQSPYQPTYFLMNGILSGETFPVIVAKLAYENGGGYLTLGLPSATVTDDVAQFSYLYKDLVEALATQNNTSQTTTGGVYAQTGVNMASIEIGTQAIDAAEIAQNLQISGGFLSHFDGLYPVEHNFFLWPDSIEVLYNDDSTVTPTGTTTTGSKVITLLSDASDIAPGMTITGTAIPSGTTVVLINGSNLTMSAAATGGHSGETLTIQGNIAAAPQSGTDAGPDTYYYQVIYEWTDNQGNTYMSAPSIPVSVDTTGASGTAGSVTITGPMLRLTQKIFTPVKILIYRWSVKYSIYYQVTSIDQPLLNNTSVDSFSFVDPFPDLDIVGNSIIYTTGGVVEDVNAPATNLMTLADSRLWLVDAEDPNLLWFSKVCIEGVPVEMSDLLTFFVAPTIGSEGSTGPITALAPMDGNLILFKENAIYYINLTAGGPDNTGANSQYSQPIFVTSIVGCANQSSIVLTQEGLMFQSNKGIWILNRGLGISYVGSPVEAFNSSVVTSAAALPSTNRVVFTLNTGQTLMYDYFYQQWGTWVGAPAIGGTIYQGLHTILNQYGQILQETPGVYLDGSNPVLLSFLTGWIQLQGISGYQRIYELQLLGQYFSPHLLNVQMGYDFGALSEQVTIDPINQTGVYGSDQLYGQTSPWGGPPSLEQWRIQPATQKCQAFQFSLQEIFDPSYGTTAGAGFTLSALTCVLGVNRGYRPVKAATTAGTS